MRLESRNLIDVLTRREDPAGRERGEVASTSQGKRSSLTLGLRLPVPDTEQLYMPVI